MTLLWLLIGRDLRQAWTSAGLWLPVAFLLLVASLYPFAVGPDAALLARTGGGMIWIAALLASLLPVDRLIAPDAQNGVLDQIAVRGIGEETVVLARLVAHWIGFGPPLMVATPPAAALLKLSAETILRLEIGLLVGTPALAALGLLVATLTAGLLALPLAVPLLIFGAGTLGDGSGAALKFLAASSLLLVAITPFAGGAAIRTGRE